MWKEWMAAAALVACSSAHAQQLSGPAEDPELTKGNWQYVLVKDKMRGNYYNAVLLPELTYANLDEPHRSLTVQASDDFPIMSLGGFDAENPIQCQSECEVKFRFDKGKIMKYKAILIESQPDKIYFSPRTNLLKMLKSSTNIVAEVNFMKKGGEQYEWHPKTPLVWPKRP